jgi:3-methylcrotonyl-CoA carboxylase alpha subunit
MILSIHKILIANRGEIACRIMRTAKKLGIATVAVFSEADRNADHVALADEAFLIGPPPARESYLNSAKIIEAARRADADAIHPGYGFLSENAEFAEACARAGLAFIGPPARAIRAMGDKARAKALMEKAGVPLLPGYHGDDQTPQRLIEEASRIGYPVLIKPSAGGGGKGMKVAASRQEFESALDSAKREALGAFGDEKILLETFLHEPRHVEVQIFADQAGHVVHLFDRDCSIQRRHQKIIEEAPAPGLSDALRAAMREAAILAAREIAYVGAGTIEFLVPASSDRFYFLEMNTRLQVEHPVTERITGLDLVEWQIRVAEGFCLPLSQEDIKGSGHAIEARLYAEDPRRDFLPQTGVLRRLEFPAEGAHLRVDAGAKTGDTISPFYDPLIAKIIAFAKDRPAAIATLHHVLGLIRIGGVRTNLGFLRAVITHDAFKSASLDTNFIERHRDELIPPFTGASNEVLALAIIGLLCARRIAARTRAEQSGDPTSPWNAQDSFRLNHAGEETITLRELTPDGPEDRNVLVTFLPNGWRLALPGDVPIMHAFGTLERDGSLIADLDDHRVRAHVLDRGTEVSLLAPDGSEHRFARSDRSTAQASLARIDGQLTAPMPGRVAALLVEPGAKVEAGQPVLVIEAMKMEHLLRAPSAGIVETFTFALGDQVEEGARLVTFRALSDQADSPGRKEIAPDSQAGA